MTSITQYLNNLDTDYNVVIREGSLSAMNMLAYYDDPFDKDASVKKKVGIGLAALATVGTGAHYTSKAIDAAGEAAHSYVTDKTRSGAVSTPDWVSKGVQFGGKTYRLTSGSSKSDNMTNQSLAQKGLQKVKDTSRRRGQEEGIKHVQEKPISRGVVPAAGKVVKEIGGKVEGLGAKASEVLKSLMR